MKENKVGGSKVNFRTFDISALKFNKDGVDDSHGEYSHFKEGDEFEIYKTRYGRYKVKRISGNTKKKITDVKFILE